jgi:hypothetical protein
VTGIDPSTEAAGRGWTFAAEAEPPSISGAVFGAIASGVVSDLVTAPGFEFGTIAGFVGGSRTEQYGTVTVTMNVATPVPVDYGFLSIRLPRPMPHFVVDATANDGARSSLPIRIDGRQRVSLEGDFDDHFALYAPEGYDRDARYLFTPDVMALLIDETGDYDVELADDRLTVFTPTPWDLTDPTTWTRIDQLVGVLGGQAVRQASRYRDDRAGPGEVVGSGGRRLDQGVLSRRGVAVGAVIALVVSLGLTVGWMVLMFAVILASGT